MYQVDSTAITSPPSSAWIWGFWAALGLFILVGITLFHVPRSKDLTTRWYGSAAAGALFALIALLAGSVAEFKNEDILKAPPLRYTVDSPVSAPTVFWVSVVLLAAIGVAYYAAVDRQREQELQESRKATADLRVEIGKLEGATAAAREHTTKLIEQLRTLPPEGFMRDFPRLSADMLAPFTEALVSKDPQKIESAVRWALRVAALMAARFGRSSAEVVYNANAMRFFPASALPPISRWTPDQLRLYPEGHRGDAIFGALCFDPEQTSSSASENAARLAGMRELFILVPNPPRDRPRGHGLKGDLRTLPGCATAFVTGKPFMAHDTLDMRNSLAGHSVSEAVAAASDKYFRGGDGGAVRSFVSLPIVPGGVPDAAEEPELDPSRPNDAPLGVLNVEMSTPYIFEGKAETVSHFALAVAPVCFVIAALWRLQDEVARPKGL